MLLKNLILVLFVVFSASCQKKQTKTPNIILIVTDDQGYGDISAYGSPDVATPNIDKLKSESINLEDFQVSPTCAPTRAAMMSGKHPFKTGVTHTVLERERMALGITTLPEVLKKGGYITGLFGKWHLGDEKEYQPINRGFDEVFMHGAGGIGQTFVGSCADVPDNKYIDPIINHNGKFVQTKGFCTDIFFTQTLSWVKENATKKKPFFAYLATNAPHGPFIAPDSYKEKFKKKKYPKSAQGFYGMIENIDDNMGILLKKLNDWGIADNTVLIFMSDNGKTTGGANKVHGKTYNAGLKGFKGSVNEGGTKVPFFIRWPKHFTAGQKIDVLLNHYDILPTLAEIAGVDISNLKDLDGRSFLAHLKSKKTNTEDRYRFFHTGRWPIDATNIPNELLRKKWIGTPETSKPENSKYKKCAVRNQRFRLVNNVELYDIINDPGETKNIISEHPDVVAKMRTAYDEWWKNVKPYMINENLPLATEKPYWVNYNKQKESGQIREWIKPDIE
ncbi:arylsulfatase [Polaribacter sp.]|uniref:arylsulfatase n=1 Tax=Polaribacter sp. TaxID=1920175 RepID=UPI0025E18871|nr:arylsulfatase [Polaribacter sp.]